MHSIEILGEPSRIPGIEEIDWFLMEYLSDYGIDLTIEHRDLSKEGVYGWCMSLHGNEFFIQIHDDLSDKDYTKTILHELYHVYQHLKKEPRCEICAHQMETILVDRFNKSL